MAIGRVVVAHEGFRRALGSAMRDIERAYERERHLYEERKAKAEALAALTADDIAAAASVEGVIRFDEERGCIVFSIADMCLAKDDPRHMCVREYLYGVCGDRVGRLFHPGMLHPNDAGASIIDPPYKHVGRFNKALGWFMRDVMVHRLDVLARRSRGGEIFVGAEWAFHAEYPDELGGLARLKRDDALALLRRVNPAIGVKHEPDGENAGRIWFIKMMGKETTARLDERGDGGFVEGQSRGLAELRDLCESGNENIAVLGMILASMFRGRRAFWSDGPYSETAKLAREISEDGLRHPGQAVSLCKEFLRANADGEERVNSLYRGLLMAHKAAFLEFERMDLWEMGFADRIARMSDIARRAGESPKGAGVARLFARGAADGFHRLHVSLNANAEAYKREWEDFCVRVWRLLSRAERAGLRHAALAADLRTVFEFCLLRNPDAVAYLCDDCAYAPLPRSSTWSGLMKTARAGLARHEIHLMERARETEENRGGVIEWMPRFAEEFAAGDALVTEISDSARLRMLGNDFSNCVGQRSWAMSCARGAMRLFTVRVEDCFEPGGLFALSLNRGDCGDWRRTDLAVKEGRGLSRREVTEIADEVAAMLPSLPVAIKTG